MGSSYKTGIYPREISESDVNSVVQKLDKMVDDLMDMLHIPDADEPDAGEDTTPPSCDHATEMAIRAIDAVLDDLQKSLGMSDKD